MAQIHLQDYGMADAIQVKDIKVGMILIWNWGFKSEVVGVAKETKTQIVFNLKSLQDGVVRERRMSKERYCGIYK